LQQLVHEGVPRLRCGIVLLLQAKMQIELLLSGQLWALRQV
jgi:hypothetical protein